MEGFELLERLRREGFAALDTLDTDRAVDASRWDSLNRCADHAGWSREDCVVQKSFPLLHCLRVTQPAAPDAGRPLETRLVFYQDGRLEDPWSLLKWTTEF